ncbi:sterol O-acyltransferase 2 [Cricetulus griseus]|nr:sterol O-acyltransferase 2 [Cricetulus griseus]
MEVQHFRTIYHMFIAGLCVLIISTLAIDLIDEGRLMLEFDLLIFSFGQLPLALMTWVPMFLSTLLVPYQTLRLWARPSTGGTWMLGAGLGCALLAAHGAMLCILPVHVAVKHQLPPASKCVLVFEQALGCVLYACFILARLCVPVFANMSREPFSTRALLLSILHATGPGIFMLLLIFFAFLHCWLNAFAEMLRFGDRMFYRDWWNSTSFSNYYRTWNVVVHDWLYSYVYQDGLWIKGQICGACWPDILAYLLLGMRARKVAMLGVFLVSAVVHEYIFCFVLGFFYPVMLMQFLVVGGLLNFTMNDRHTGPAWNVLMWTLLFLGQGIQSLLSEDLPEEQEKKGSEVTATASLQSYNSESLSSNMPKYAHGPDHFSQFPKVNDNNKTAHSCSQQAFSPLTLRSSPHLYSLTTGISRDVAKDRCLETRVGKDGNSH